jgi:hypothetical protein
MKLLLETTERGLLLEKAALLEARGIPVHIDDVPHAGVVPSHLYVVFDRHYEDARSLLHNADHPVRQPLTAEEMDGIAEAVREVKLSIGSGIAERLLIGLLVIMSVGYIGSRLFD